MNRSNEQLDQLSTVTSADIEAAKAKVSGTVVGKLLDAELVDDVKEKK